MLAYAGGDAGAFERLYAKHKGPLFLYVRKTTQPHIREFVDFYLDHAAETPPVTAAIGTQHAGLQLNARF